VSTEARQQPSPGGQPAQEIGRVGEEVSGQREWELFCDRVKAAGSASLSLRRDLSAQETADGLRFLARVLMDAVSAQLGPPDFDGPFVNRFLDEFTAYGIPNTDNAYLFSRVSGERSYRMTGTNHGRMFILTSGTGDYPYWDYRELAERHSSTFACGPDGHFDVLISAVRPGGHRGDWFQLDPSATLLMIRDYVVDWDVDPGWFHLECLDPDFTPDVECQAPDAVRDRFRRAAEQFSWTAQFWTGYPDRWRGNVPNAFPETDRPDMVSQSLLQYRVGWVQLQPSEALLIEIEPPDGVYWSIQLYSMWGLPLDPHVAPSSLNSSQAVRDQDGRVRLVVASKDPGAANWLDLRGYPEAVVWYRVMSPDGGGTPTTRVVPLTDVTAMVPEAQRIDGGERAKALAERRRAAARRFRR
jgi:Protein of unknown function (DUF1214)